MWFYLLISLLYHCTSTLHLLQDFLEYDIINYFSKTKPKKRGHSSPHRSSYLDPVYLISVRVCVCVCAYTLPQQWPFRYRRRAEQLIMFVWFFIFVKPADPPSLTPPHAGLFVSTDSRLALNIHGGCQPLAHTKAGLCPWGLGQGGWRSRAHAERLPSVRVRVRERAKKRERPFSLPSSASPNGIREQQWKGKEEGQKDRSALWSMRARAHTSVVRWGTGWRTSILAPRDARRILSAPAIMGL